MKTDPTIDTAPVRQWFEILSKFGADRARLLQLLECDEGFLRERDNRIATRCHHVMLHCGAREIDIPGIVLLAGAKTTAQSLGVVGHLMMNCETLLGAGRVSGFSLHAGVAAWADERKKLERLSEGGPDVTSVGQLLRKSAYR